MPIDFNKPETTDNYSTGFVPNLNNAIRALGSLLDPTYAGTISNAPVGTKRLNAGLFEQFNGSSWVALSMGYPTNAGAGAAGTWGINISGTAAATSQTAFPNLSTSVRLVTAGSQGASIGTATGSLGGIEVTGNGTNAAFMAFHRPGQWAAYFGLDTDNQFKVGGWSVGAAAYVLLHANNFNTYAPTLSGSGANGTWPINITGNCNSASLLGGFGFSSSVVANGIVQRDAYGYTYASYLNLSSGNSENPVISQLLTQNSGDGFVRKSSIAHVTAAVLAQSGQSSNAFGTRTVSTAAPSGGADGDVWYRY
jgi:hypothetical protein